MRVLVLGSAAGGGFPKWNCACALRRGIARDVDQLLAEKASRRLVEEAP